MPNGDEIHGRTGDDTRGAAIGKEIQHQQVSIYADRETWREFVRRDLLEHWLRIERIEARVTIALVAIMVIFACGFFAVGLVIRNSDLTYLQMDRSNIQMERRMDRLERMIPTPTPWWPGGVP